MMKEDALIPAKSINWVLLLIANLFGVLLAWIDSRPSWDDAGITVAMLLVLSGIFGSIGYPWVWGLSVGIWIPLRSVILAADFAMILVLGIAMVGAYLGALARRILLPVN